MDSVLLLALVVSAFTGALSASSAIDVKGHAATKDTGSLYPRYPACDRGREFAIKVGKTERVDGRVYYERVKPDGEVQYYICASCTVCADYGLGTASPCTERANAECSVDCLVPGCTFDETSTSCRLTSTSGTSRDDVSFCRSPMTTQMAATGAHRPLESKKSNPSKLRQAPTHDELTTVMVVGVGASSNLHKVNHDPTLQPVRRSEKPTSKSPNVSSWVASEALFVGTGIVTAVIIANIAAFLYIRSKKRESKRRKRQVTNSTEVLYAALARARTDSNVASKSGHSDSVTSHSGSVTAV